jgi:hypothetical protein
MREESFFNFLILFSYFVLFSSFFGLSLIAPHFLNLFETYVKLYICLSLLIRFNPLRNAKFNSLDRKIAFSAGLLLLSSTILNSYKIKLIHFAETHFIKNKQKMFFFQ